VLRIKPEILLSKVPQITESPILDKPGMAARNEVRSVANSSMNDHVSPDISSVDACKMIQLLHHSHRFSLRQIQVRTLN